MQRLVALISSACPKPAQLTAAFVSYALIGPAYIAAPAAAQSVQEKVPVALPIDPNAVTTNWNICNQTSYVLDTANAYQRGTRVQASGWQRLNPGACIVEITPKDSPRYLYAQSAPIHQGDIREWSGKVALCTAQTDFTLDAASLCSDTKLDEQGQDGNGQTLRNFLAVDPKETRTDLIEPAEFGDKAETAGLQRLLKDAGYKISRIDGVAGRRTSKTVSSFKKDKDLTSTISGPELFLALIRAAKEAKTSTGLEVCNQSSTQIWTAIATRHQGGWQSRGWWDTPPSSCTKTYNATLDGTEMHIFALQEQYDERGNPLADRHLRTVATIPSQFCIAEGKFTALGREFCTENGYNIANFRPVTTENKGTKLTLTDTDFIDLNPAGLRR